METGREASAAIRIRPLEREDLKFVHGLDNNANVMRYWFEEPYEAFVELQDLYNKHIHDQSERRFIVDHQGQNVGLVELVEIDYIHRRAEFQIIIDPAWQNHGFATAAAKLAMAYAFDALNLYKLYLVVDNENVRAIHVYSKLGFQAEGVLIHEFFANGALPRRHAHVHLPARIPQPLRQRQRPAAALPGDGRTPSGKPDFVKCSSCAKREHFHCKKRGNGVRLRSFHNVSQCFLL